MVILLHGPESHCFRNHHGGSWRRNLELKSSTVHRLIRKGRFCKPASFQQFAHLDCHTEKKKQSHICAHGSNSISEMETLDFMDRLSYPVPDIASFALSIQDFITPSG